MAEKNIQMQRKNADGTFELHFPLTKVGNVAGAATAADLNAHKAEEATLAQAGHVKHATLSTTLNTTWSGSAAPYSKAQTVSGILATDTPIIDVVMSGTFATDEKRAEAWAYIYRAVTSANTITFYATEKPAVDLPLQIKVVR